MFELKKTITKIILFSFIMPIFLFAQIHSVKHPKWSYNSTIYEANIRQYTPEGTFKAFEEHLPELKKMGVDIIWLMPINPIGKKNRKGILGSYYSVENYKAINPEFGTSEDFKRLVERIHKMGMHVIIDWVADHTSWDNVWVKTHPDFYERDKNGNFVPPVPNWTDVIKLNYRNKDLRRTMINAMKYWVKKYNIDGFRCDVAFMVPTDFWIAARKALDKIKPVFMLAEADQVELDAAFDMTYNWKLNDMMNNIAKGEKDANDLEALLKNQSRIYPPNAYLMNFTSNHDENSWKGTVFERLGKGAEVFAVLTATIKGMPLVYSGQEAGLNKRLRFFSKDTIIWKSSEFRKLYTKLFNLKRNNPALYNGIKGGAMIRIKTNDDKDIFAFIRRKNGDKVLTILNLSPDNVNVFMNSDYLTGIYTNLFNNTKEKFGHSGKVFLKAWGYRVFYLTSKKRNKM